MASTKKKRTTTSTAKSTAATAKVAPKALAKKQEQELANPASKALIAKRGITTSDLFRWNKWLAWFYAAQGIMLVVLSATRSYPVEANFLSPNPLVTDHVSLASASRHLFDVNMAWLLAVMLFVAAAVHLLAATKYRTRYEVEVERGASHLRWMQYGLSGGLALIAVSLLVGGYNIALISLIFVTSCLSGALGLLSDRSDKDTRQLPFGLSVLAAASAWIVLGFSLIAAVIYGAGHIPAFIYGVYGVLLACFAGHFVNVYLQQTKKGRYADSLYGERMAMVLWAVAYTALVWQIFAGTLQP
jgi:hypothetical protein